MEYDIETVKNNLLKSLFILQIENHGCLISKENLIKFISVTSDEEINSRYLAIKEKYSEEEIDKILFLSNSNIGSIQ